MFCANCGKEIPDYAKFCNYCGARQEINTSTSFQSAQQQTPRQNYAPQQNYEPRQPVPTPKSGKKMKVGGIILLILGALSVIGAFANGSYMYMQYAFDLSDLVEILMQIGLIFGGILLIVKSKRK